uniref:Uncharacterized protein n=1 Tax=Romanomermis culicivorax TaxID=13658 RepID=A0A915IIK1_ROMCU
MHGLQPCGLANVLIYLQEPIDRYDKDEIIAGQTDRNQHHNHGDNSRLRDASGAYTGQSGRQAVKKQRRGERIVGLKNHRLVPDQYNVAQRHHSVQDLGDVQGGHSFVQSCAVHVYCGSEGIFHIGRQQARNLRIKKLEQPTANLDDVPNAVNNDGNMP